MGETCFVYQGEEECLQCSDGEPKRTKTSWKNEVGLQDNIEVDVKIIR